jgi:hypothetical protein
MSRHKISLNTLSGPDSRDLSVRDPAGRIRVSAWSYQTLSEVPACYLGITRGRVRTFYLPVLPLYGFTKLYTNPFLIIYLLPNFKLPVLVLFLGFKAKKTKFVFPQFGSQKRKADLLLGSKHESHRPDRVNFSRPRVRTRSTAAAGASCSLSDIPEEPSIDLQEHPIPNINSRMTHVTAIHETACKETEWHISRLPKTSTKACFAQQAITKKNCKARIVQGNTATATPTYTGVMEHYQKKTDKVMEFFFCNN